MYVCMLLVSARCRCLTLLLCFALPLLALNARLALTSPVRRTNSFHFIMFSLLRSTLLLVTFVVSFIFFAWHFPFYFGLFRYLFGLFFITLYVCCCCILSLLLCARKCLWCIVHTYIHTHEEKTKKHIQIVVCMHVGGSVAASREGKSENRT